ncbi:MAG: aminotransferase class V-fold PLP-dependent enzyme [Pirellulaceae bacterium]|nr:aminotransferase class V-fold PLP-dependent enzyme [Pirellulaceae bacterium]
MATETASEVLDVYKSLGVRPIINAAGTITTLGGSLMPPEVVAAWNAASQSFVRLPELQDRVGERIAKLLDVDAALVTTGAAGGILVGTAAAVTHRDHSLISRLPLPPEMGLEVIRQSSHRECYDNQVKTCGVKLVDVKTRDDLERAINQRTVMMFSYNVQEGESKISQQDWVEVARRHKIPTLLDAAADTPPVDALSKYNKLGYDMVVFSGGKAIRGPQDAGLLLGSKDLIETAKLNTAPRCGNIGRGMKVSKEDMVAMWAAVERFVKLDHAAELREWEQRIQTIEDAVAKIPSGKTRRVPPPIAHQVPHLVIDWDEQQVKVAPDQVKQTLAAGEPSIVTARVHGTGQEGFLISVFMLKPGEANIVAARVAEILKRAAS